MKTTDNINENIRILKETMLDLQSNKNHKNKGLGLVLISSLFDDSIKLEKRYMKETGSVEGYFERIPFYSEVLTFSKKQYLEGGEIPEDTKLYQMIKLQLKC